MDPITLIVTFQIATAERPFEIKSFRDMPTCEAFARERRKDPDVLSAKCGRWSSEPWPVVDPPPKGIMVR